MKTRFHAGVAFAFGACAAGCAAPGASPVTTATAAAHTLSAHDAKNARDAIIIGKSTKAGVIAALGKATVISFDSGFEVWVYLVTGDTPAKPGWAEPFGRAGSEKGTLGKTEFVLLFAPSGVVAKTRIRPAPSPSEAKGT